jgi:calcium-dependent protein kinase
MIKKNEHPIEEVYKMGKKALGTGGFGVVTKCRHRVTKLDRACKTISRKKVRNIEQFRAEISILVQLDHPHILKLIEYFEDDKNFYLITELCAGGELFDKIIEKEFFNEYEAAKVFKQMMLGINYCHNNGIVHRDLKPENFLYETKDANSDLKIIDFGLSKVFKPGKGGVSKMQTKAGTVSDKSFILLTIFYFIAILHFS